MIGPHLQNPDGRPVWLVPELAGSVTWVVYCEPERMIVGTWNMLLTAVIPDLQELSIGSALTIRLEALLRDRCARVLIVEPSDLPDYARTRAFHRKHHC